MNPLQTKAVCGDILPFDVGMKQTGTPETENMIMYDPFGDARLLYDFCERFAFSADRLKNLQPAFSPRLRRALYINGDISSSVTIILAA